MAKTDPLDLVFLYRSR
ncbi:hypothetical protein VTH06DRAFT_2830 [Thermothelomyces fergusii]